MNRFILALVFAAAALAANAQTSTKPATTPAPKSSSASTAAKPSTASAPVPAWIKLPPGVPVVAHGPVKVPFSLRYEEIKVGTGPLAEPHKIYRVKYTGWLAADGHKFDSSDDHPAEPVYDSALQQVKGDDGKPKMIAGQPILFMQGRPGMIPGWDLGFGGMHVGGKRRVFVPYQLAYGEPGRPSADPKNPGIPPKADLIFDIELVEMMEPPAPPARPTMPPRPGPMTPHPGAGMPPNPAPGQPGTSAAPAGSAAPAMPPAPAQPPPPPPAPTPPPAPAASPAPAPPQPN